MADKNTNYDEIYLDSDGIPVLSALADADSTWTKAPGTIIGDYRLIKEIGRGATAVVYLCEQIHSGKEYAIKMLQEGVATDWHRKMLKNEARLTGRLDHKYIARIHDADHEKGYIVMEYADGKSLDCFSSSATLLPVHIVVSIIKEVAEALNYSSQKNVLHLDIKPGNIIVSNDFSRVKIMDFGCASIDGNRDDLLQIAGSVNYMSPEQLTLDGKIDVRTDIYSLGAVFYRLVTGKVTYKTKKEELSLSNITRLIRSKPHVPVLAYRHDVDSNVVEIIDKMLAKNPESRYASWFDVILDLAKLSADIAKPSLEPVKPSAEPAKLSAEPVKRPSNIEQSRIDLISGFALFKGLGESDIYELIRNSDFRELAAYETLMKEGESGDIFHLILQGEVNVYKRGNLLWQLNPGETIGEEICCTELSSKYCFTAKAKQKVTALAIQKSMRRQSGISVRDKLNEALLKSMNTKILHLEKFIK